MIGNVVLRLLLALAAAWVAGWAYEEAWFRNQVRSRFAPIVSEGFFPLLSPLYALILNLLALMIKGDGNAGLLFRAGLVLEFRLLLPVLGVTLLLWPLLPLLRKHVSSEGCAALLVLPFVLPIVWVLTLVFPTIRRNPWLVVQIPESLVRILPGVWIGGVLFTLGWKLLSHFRFRRRLLKDTVPALDWEQDLFRELREALCRQGPKNSASRLDIPLVHSPAVSSPLTVGLFRRSTRLVLPVRDYSEEELRMILRHEIIHLLRGDNSLKLSITVLCALGWFLPSLWVGMRRTAEDVELCCDNLTTSGMDAPQRRRYAELLLSESGTTRGFTTCLSASAAGLRYRMREILHPVLRETGSKVIALLMAIFVFFSGTLAIGIGTGTVGTEFLDRGWRIAGGTVYQDGERKALSCGDLEACLREVKITEPTWDTSSNRYGFYRTLAEIRLENREGQPASLYVLDNKMGWETSLSDYSPGTPRFLEFVLSDASGDREESRFYALLSPVDLDQLRDSAGVDG